MADIRHRVGIAASQAQVYDALATTDGVAQWWTRNVEGDAKVGGSLAFRFGTPDPSATMEIVNLTPNQRVDWLCIQGPDEWVGTNLRFELQASGDETVLLFTHADWREPVEFMHHCSTKWAVFLLGLKAGLEGGNATPYPDDGKISSWG
ncbi:MAG: SRPBCC family protein [Dehalococcoidia bacterium]